MNGDTVARLPAPQACLGVVTEQSEFGVSAKLRGTQQALQAHPRCPAGMFDGYGTRWKASRTLHIDGRRHQVVATGRQFCLTIYWTDAERRAGWARCDAAVQMQAKAKAVQHRLAQVPRQVSQWRAEQAEFLSMCMGAIELAARGETTCSGGYALDGDAQALVGIHLQAIRQAFETAPVVFDAQLRQADVAKIMAPLREANPSVQAMLQRAQGGLQ